MLKKFRNSEFEDLLKEGKVLLFFSAPWCGYCRMLNEELKDLEKNHDDIKIIQVDVDEHKEIAIDYRILSIPVLIFYEDGKKKKSMSGYKPLSELEKFIAKK